MDAVSSETTRTVTGRSSRFAAMQMALGNLISMLLPPLPLLWFGGSMLIYALHRHHPNPRVGHYTQHAAYRFYGLMAAIIPIGTFFPGRGITPWLMRSTKTIPSRISRPSASASALANGRTLTTASPYWPRPPVCFTNLPRTSLA